MENTNKLDNSTIMEMLSKSKRILDKVESGNFETGNVDSNLLSQSSDNLVEQKNLNHAYKNLKTTKMDPRIIKSMLENPIIPENGLTKKPFTIDDANNSKFFTKSKSNINESVSNHNSNYRTTNERIITLTESELDKKIKDTLLEFMALTFTKNLTESTIKKTINTLIKEGKIKVSTRKK